MRNYLKTVGGRAAGIGVAVAVLLFAVFTSIRSLRPNNAVSASKNRVFINAQTGRVFTHQLSPGETLPVMCPDTGTQSGYPAERCYWTRDGQVKREPAYVLLKEYKGERGPTFCPDCGRLVTRLNPPGVPGQAPPTEAEYKPEPPAR